MPNMKYFFDFLLLKIFTGHNIENSSEKSWPQVNQARKARKTINYL